MKEKQNPTLHVKRREIKKPDRLRDIPKFLFSGISSFLSRLFYIIRIVWETSPLILILMAVIALLEGVLPVLGAYISRDLLNAIASLIGVSADSGTVFEILKPVIFLLIFQFVYLVFQKIVERVNSSISAIAGELVVNHIKLKIIGKAKEVDLSSFDRPSFYEKLENANREAGMRPIMILTASFKIISAVISVISFIVVLVTLSPFAPIIIILAALPGAIVNYFYRNRNFRYIRNHSLERREMNYYSAVMTHKDFAKEIKLLDLGDELTDKYKNAFSRYFRGLRRLIIREGVLRVLVSVFSTLASCAIFVYVAYDVVFNNGMIGDYSLYSGALTSVAAYVSTIVSSSASIYEGTLFIDNMMEFMREEVKIKPIVDNPVKPMRGVPHKIEFKGVSFSYPGCERKVLDNIDLTFEAGEKIVLVGLNGAGKTTLIKLLTRLYDPTEGEIYLDGRDIREYETAALYDMFGIIFQDFGKYAVTAAENIEFGDISRSHNREDVISAAKSGDADGFILALPNGYDTSLTKLFNEDGIELSGGQWQKLCVARAFYKESDILILDEPTAALDALAEQEIFNQFSMLAEGKISIFVSHRLSSATLADKIVVINAGKISEIGSHEELMKNKGEYHKLFSTQAQRYIASVEE